MAPEGMEGWGALAGLGYGLGMGKMKPGGLFRTAGARAGYGTLGGEAIGMPLELMGVEGARGTLAGAGGWLGAGSALPPGMRHQAGMRVSPLGKSILRHGQAARRGAWDVWSRPKKVWGRYFGEGSKAIPGISKGVPLTEKIMAGTAMAGTAATLASIPVGLGLKAVRNAGGEGAAQVLNQFVAQPEVQNALNMANKFSQGGMMGQAWEAISGVADGILGIFLPPQMLGQMGPMQKLMLLLGGGVGLAGLLSGSKGMMAAGGGAAALGALPLLMGGFRGQPGGGQDAQVALEAQQAPQAAPEQPLPPGIERSTGEAPADLPQQVARSRSDQQAAFDRLQQA